MPEDLMAQKLELIQHTADLDIDSIVDLGGMWGVKGGYLDHATALHNAHGLQVDYTANMPNHRNYSCDFADWLSEILSHTIWGRFDMAILFDTLLHQICPVKVLKDLTVRCEKVILIAQPCLDQPRPVSENIQFASQARWEELHLDQLDVCASEHGRPTTWTTAAWAWGQSPLWITATMKGFGWTPRYRSSCAMAQAGWIREALAFVPAISNDTQGETE